MLVREGNNSQGGEAGQRHSHPHPDVEVTVGSGRSREPEGVHPFPSTPR